MKGAAGVSGELVRGRLCEVGEGARFHVVDEGGDFVEGCEGGGCGGAGVEEEELGFGDAGFVGEGEDYLCFGIGVGGAEVVGCFYGVGDEGFDDDFVAALGVVR